MTTASTTDSLTADDIRDALKQRLVDQLFTDELIYRFFDETQRDAIYEALAAAESRADAMWLTRGAQTYSAN